MSLSRKRNRKGRDRTEKRHRAQLRKHGRLNEYLEMRRMTRIAAQEEAVPTEEPVVGGVE